MGDHHGQVGHGHIGEYLKSVRESRRLSLDAVEEMTGTLPGSVTKSYLSRIENGRLEPTFPRLYALSQVYGVPIASLAERFEIDMRRRSAPAEFAYQPADAMLRDVRRLIEEGCFLDALTRIETLLDRVGSGQIDQAALGIGIDRLRTWRIVCLFCLDRLHAAKEECEDILADADGSPADHALALYHFARCCYQLGRFPLSLMAIGELERDLPTLDEPVLSVGNLVSLKGNILADMDKPHDALDAFREAVAIFEAEGDSLSACRHRINYANVLADCGKPREARKQLVEALRDARQAHYIRQTAFALHGLGKIAYQLEELRPAESYLLESNKIGRQQEYISLVFCNCYWLWRIARDHGDAAAAATHRRSLRSYLPRVPEALAEARAFRSTDTGGAR